MVIRPPSAAVLLVLAASIAAAASCRTGVARPSPFPGARMAPRDLPLPAPVLEVDRVLATAQSLSGTPYLFGGDTPAAGFDCSGFVRYVYAQVGVPLPRTTEEQFSVGRNVGNDRVEAGDLVFFSTTGPGPTHVGIALDPVTFVHAPGTGAVVRVERFDTSYWQSRRLGNRRLTAR